jgi:hypothetical protein
VPRCNLCGNTNLFNSKNANPVRPLSNTGLQALFSDEGTIANVEYYNASLEMVNAAWKQPELYFDRCGQCGSSSIIWP